MSWYTDPQLFINFYCQNPSQFYWVDRIAKKYDVPLSRGDISCTEELDFCKHLSLGYNKESDYDAFKSSLAEFAYPISKLVNCQGLVVHWDNNKQSGTWSRVEEHDSIFYCLPGIKKPSGWAERLALEERISKLVAEMSLVKDEVTNLQEQLNLEKNDKQALQEKLNQEKNDRQALQEQLNQERNDRQAQFSYLTAKLEECRRGAVGCGSCNVEPWMRGCCVPSHWVPFEELDVQNVPRDVPLIITEAPGALEFGEDTTTNVQATRFCRGMFPVVVVNIADLIPNSGKARFDPDIWCSLGNAGNCYAARKPSESEMMSFDPHMRG